MERTSDRRQDTIDRLALLLVSQPREGWEDEYEELTRREIERLTLFDAGSEDE